MDTMVEKVKERLHEQGIQQWQAPEDTSGSLSLYSTVKNTWVRSLFEVGLKGVEINCIFNLRRRSIDIGERERKFRGYSVNQAPCPMCGEDNEDIFHFWGNCKELVDLRNEFVDR